MKKIISIMLIGMMTVGCGKTARLERLERERAEIAAEQARVDKLGREKGIWERFSNNTWTYVIGTAAFVAVVVGVGALIYHRYKKIGIPPGVEDLNDQPAEVHQAPQHNLVFPPNPAPANNQQNFFPQDNMIPDDPYIGYNQQPAQYNPMPHNQNIDILRILPLSSLGINTYLRDVLHWGIMESNAVAYMNAHGQADLINRYRSWVIDQVNVHGFVIEDYYRYLE
jgi:hypothetical protein